MILEVLNRQDADAGAYNNLLILSMQSCCMHTTANREPSPMNACGVAVHCTTFIANAAFPL